MIAARRALATATQRLADAGSASPAADARLLAAHVLDCSLGSVELRQLSAEQAEEFFQLVERRAGGVPVQHLTGSAAFRYLELAVGPGVFIPRPETELVAQAAIDAARSGVNPLVVDLCTGSGAIALAVATEVPGSRVVAVEADGRAADWAARNLAGSGVELIVADLRDTPARFDGSVDVVVSNPPYVPTTAASELPVDVVGVDPDAALFAGPDGLALMPDLIEVAARLLIPGGTLVVEHGEEQAAAMLEMLAAAGFGDATSHPDLTGRPRFVTARLGAGRESMSP